MRLEGQYHIISLASYFVQGSQLTNYGRPYNFLKLRMLQEYRIRIVADTLSCHIDTFQQYSVKRRSVMVGDSWSLVDTPLD